MGKQKRTLRAKVFRDDYYYVEDGGIYEVEVIKAIKLIKGHIGKYEYLVQWAGYPDEDTWEPLKNVVTCTRLLKSMWAMLGAVDPSYTKIIKLPKEWIESEIDYFHSTFRTPTQRTWHSQPCIGIIEEDGQMRQINIYD